MVNKFITPVGETHGRNVRWRWILSPHQTGIKKDKIYKRYRVNWSQNELLLKI
jgi:hypothetical protein